jgi:hypothetical protein
MRAIAILASYNEERFIGPCLEHLLGQGIDAYLIDNSSTDETRAIARRYLNHGLVGLEIMPRDGMYRWRALLQRKEELAATLPGDWFMHQDPDEFRLAPHPGQTLQEALAAANDLGYNAVNFVEFTFVPTWEAPDHDHAAFLQTMRWYYPFAPRYPCRLNAWRKQPVRINLNDSAGHLVNFPGLRWFPQSFPMRHYLYLSPAHALRKCQHKAQVPEEARRMGWHGWRLRLRGADIPLPNQAALRYYESDADLDASWPLTRHLIHGPRQAA